jgi:hypothetical protein
LPAYQLSWEQNLHFAYFSELLVEFGHEQEDSEKLFRLTLAVLGAAEKVSVTMLARYFEFWLLRLEGVLPALDQLLPEKLATRASAMLRLHPSELENSDLSEGEIGQLESAAQRLIEYHLEKPLKAFKVLKELL